MAASSPKGDTVIVEPPRSLQQQGRRAAEARATVPDATYTRTVTVTREDAAGDHVIGAFARALRHSPQANAAYRDAQLEQYGRVNVGLVLPDGDGTVSVTLLDADSLSVAELSAVRAELTAKLAAGAIIAPDAAGATCSVTDLSRTGVESFAAVLTAPHAVALAIGGRQPNHTITVTLTADQRVLSPHAAAALLDRLAAELDD